MCDGFHDIGRYQNLETKQERSANTDFLGLNVLPRHRRAEMEIGRPGDTGHDDEYAENLDPASDQPDDMIAQRFETLEDGTSGNAGKWPAARATPCKPAEPIRSPLNRYFALTLDVMELITLDAILNWSLRFSIPCRRAIQSKSV